MGEGMKFLYKITHYNSPAYTHYLNGIDLDILIKELARQGVDITLLKIGIELVKE